jgi:hypothetical protein
VGSFFPTIGSYLLSASAGASYLPRRISSLSLGPENVLPGSPSGLQGLLGALEKTLTLIKIKYAYLFYVCPQ